MVTNTEPDAVRCGKCQGSMYHDGMNWRHKANDRTREFCPQPDPTTDPALQSRMTIRMEMFEVYEKTSHGPRLLFATSDPTLARDASRPGDQIVKRWWVREGSGNV